jgi:hypothetical protein
MIRVLVMIAVAGFLVSVVSLSAAVAIGGPDFFTDSVWEHWADNGHWGWDSDDWADRHGRHGRDGGPETTRDVAWTGGDTLSIDVPADVRYTQAPGPGKITISGPEREVADVEVEDGHIRFMRHGHHHWGDLTLVVTAPAVTHFDLASDGTLSIDGYKQEKLNLDVAGSAKVTAKGEAKAVELSIAGSGVADLSDLKVADADITVDGSGETTLAPTGAVNVDIAGSGDVTLLNHPSKLETNVSGSGSIHQKDGIAPPSPPEPPAPPKPPRPPKPV